MKIERHRINPAKNRTGWLALRAQDITASVAGAILGVHEYTTRFELHALKAGHLSEDPTETPAMRRGRLLEDDALQILAEDRPHWRVTPANNVYLRAPELRIGCTPDAYAVDPERPGRGVIQVKTTSDVVFRHKWRTEGGEIELPLWIAVQAIVEAKLTKAAWAAVALLVVGHGLDLHVVEIPLHAGIWDRLVEEVRAFWQGIADGVPPPADYSRDGNALAALYPPDDGLPVLDLSADNRAPALVDERAAAAAAIREAEKLKKALDAELVEKLAGHTQATLGDGRTVVRKTIARAAYSVAATSFPQITIRTPRKAAA
ncbi:YqaJ viral recombinase family protein [Methylobacterium nodulans]|uniref:Phage-related protein endonuclease-like protein n=1 Tax=Methylobacterium nodulans (strain LMG 21967 / CNCM I-2342 / ORS 2060) TaxID=460265 RepID=B8IAP2_METNO|nr:YqaJ viral recombinase family protein [Methylobacterium nodulans]ACL61087.1 phage-related protein endonuclease-like protein [Methylobacterium nodulans ORS 2060]